MKIENPTPASTTPATSSKTPNTTIGNQDTFLKLFTYQLQHQDPDSPMNADNFTSQLAQFSSVEQLSAINDKLENISAALQNKTS